MTEQELQALQTKVGGDATKAIKDAMAEHDIKARKLAEETAAKQVSKDTFEEYQKSAKDFQQKMEDIAVKQGTTLTELALKLSAGAGQTKSIAQTLKDDEKELMQKYEQRAGYKAYMINLNEKGEFVMSPHNPNKTNDPDATKTVGPNATISGINGGTAASIFQNIDATSLLRLGGDAPIISQYRNNRWVFDLVNVINADYGTLMAMWYEEVAKTGGSTTVNEGATKPMTQYGYTLQTKTYKKEATLIGFTEEFSLDFPRLQSDILGKGRVDLINRINTAILANIIAVATAYNTAASYKTARGGAITANYNDYLGIDAMAAQVDNATFGQQANAAVMSTFRNHAVNSQMDAQGRFLMPPPLLQNLSFTGNPAMGVDDILVGDLKQYNIILRGGLILRIGYNGTDFAQNMFSAVIEQYYFDYISAMRAVAIVKGSTFAAVKTAITT